MTVWMNTANNTGSRMIIGNEGTGKLFNVYVDQNQKVNLAILDGAGTFTNTITTEESISYNAWYFVAVSWQYDSSISQLACRLYLNSKKYEKTIKTSDFKDFTGAKTAIGSNISGAYSLNGLIRKFDYSPYFLIESEILSICGVPSASQPPTIYHTYDDVWKDKLKFYNGKEITYDDIGNPKTYDGYTYTWEEGRQLKSIAGNDKNITFKYNDAGIRTEKNVGGVVVKCNNS